MKDKEMIRILVGVQQGLPGAGRRWAALESVIQALEANPPLAEVEGWIEVVSDLNWIPQSLYTLTGSRAWKPQIPVTVTIRKRDVQAK